VTEVADFYARPRKKSATSVAAWVDGFFDSTRANGVALSLSNGTLFLSPRSTGS